MHHISPYNIWIGHAGDGRDSKGLIDRGIRGVVQLAFEEPPVCPPREIIVERYPLLDGMDNPPELLRLTIRGVVSLLELRLPTLVCCGAGMSRSPAIVAAAISILERRDLQTGLALVTDHFPADISPGLWQDVVEVCRNMQDQCE